MLLVLNKAGLNASHTSVLFIVILVGSLGIEVMVVVIVSYINDNFGFRIVVPLLVLELSHFFLVFWVFDVQDVGRDLPAGGFIFGDRQHCYLL